MSSSQEHIHIVGGGVAGLTAGLCLTRAGFDVVVYERRTPEAFAGMGFLLAQNGVNVLKQLFGEGWRDEEFYTELSKLTLHDLSSGGARAQEVQDMWCVLRPKLTERLEYLYYEAGGTMITDMSLERVTLSQEPIPKIQSLTFHTPQGALEFPARYVLGADGIKSTLRSLVFGCAGIEQSTLTEYVGLSAVPLEMSERPHDELVKYYDPISTQAFGYMRLPDDQLIWYVQVERSQSLPFEDGEVRRSFILERYRGWPDEVSWIINACSFERTYRWDTADVVVMPSAFKADVMLIGDAAHATLPVSSQGVASALEDAIRFSHQLKDTLKYRGESELSHAAWRQTCERFDQMQHPLWRRRQAEARALQARFLEGRLTEGVPVVNS